MPPGRRAGAARCLGTEHRFRSCSAARHPRRARGRRCIGNHGNAGFGDNVAAIDYASEQFGYLLGVLGARMTKTGKIGAVAGLEGLSAVGDPMVYVSGSAEHQGPSGGGPVAVIARAR